MNITFIAALLGSVFVSVEAGPVSPNCAEAVATINSTQRPKLSKLMSHKHIRNLKADDVDDNCMDTIVRAVVNNYPASNEKILKMLQSDKSFFKKAADNGNVDVTRFSIKHVQLNALSTFLNHKKFGNDYCRSLTPSQIQALALSKKKAAIIRPECFAEFPGSVDFGKKGITRFPKNILSVYEGPFHESWYTMTKAQLADYDQHKSLKPYRCAANFDCSKLSVKLFKALPNDCFCNWLENDPQPLSKKQLKELTVDRLKACKAHVVEAGLSTLISGNWKWASRSVIDYMTTEPDLADQVHYEAIRSDSKVNKSSFYCMEDLTKLKVMEIVKDLPDDLFAEILPIQIYFWDNVHITKKDKKHCTKYQCFELVRDRSNVKALMANIPLYNCVDLSFTKLRGAWTFGEHMTRACYKDMSVDADKLADYENIHENVLQFAPPYLVRKAFSKDWEDFAKDFLKVRGKNYKHPSVWRGVLRNPKVCRDLITPSVFKTLQKEHKLEALEGFSSGCVRQIRFIAELTEQDIKAFGPKVYSAFTKDDKSKISFKKSSVEQLANISSDVANLADHFASQVKSLQNYSDELVGMMGESWFRAFPAETWGTISASHVGVIQASHLSNVCHDKWSGLSPAAQKALTADQVTALGTQCGDEKAQVEALKKFSLSEDAAKALKTRAEALGDGAVHLVGAGLLSMAAGLALLTPIL